MLLLFQEKDRSHLLAEVYVEWLIISEIIYFPQANKT